MAAGPVVSSRFAVLYHGAPAGPRSPPPGPADWLWRIRQYADEL